VDDSSLAGLWANQLVKVPKGQASIDEAVYIALVKGPAAGLKYAKLYLPNFETAVRRDGTKLLQGDVDYNIGTATGMLCELNVAACCGGDVSARERKLQSIWLPQLAKLSASKIQPFFRERYRRLHALQACVANMPELVPQIAKAKAPKFVPGQTFGSDSRQLALYLAAALTAKRTRADVEPAWHDYLRELANHVHGDNVIAGLMLAARVVYSMLGDVEENAVAAEVRKLLRPSARQPKA
jgi:hypothetical protein